MTHRSWLDENGELVSQPTLTVEELKAVVDEAHGWRKKVACHAYNGTRTAARARWRLRLDRARPRAHRRRRSRRWSSKAPGTCPRWPSTTTTRIRRIRDSGKTRSQARRRAWRLVSKALHAGVKIAFGTDVGGFAWTDPIAQEFAREVEFGMTPMQAIQSATSRAAELLGKKGELGVIAPGALADLIAVKGDPLQDVARPRKGAVRDEGWRGLQIDARHGERTLNGAAGISVTGDAAAQRDRQCSAQTKSRSDPSAGHLLQCAAHRMGKELDNLLRAHPAVALYGGARITVSPRTPSTFPIDG